MRIERKEDVPRWNITAKLLSNKVLADKNGKLKFAVNIVYVFPLLRRADAKKRALPTNKRLRKTNKPVFNFYAEKIHVTKRG